MKEGKEVEMMRFGGRKEHPSRGAIHLNTQIVIADMHEVDQCEALPSVSLPVILCVDSNLIASKRNIDIVQMISRIKLWEVVSARGNVQRVSELPVEERQDTYRVVGQSGCPRLWYSKQNLQVGFLVRMWGWQESRLWFVVWQVAPSSKNQLCSC